MPKMTYTATDPAGTVHTRKTDRVYSHTVVRSGGYAVALANANHKNWASTDASNFEWNRSIVEGRNPHYPAKRWREAPRWTPEQIAEEDALLAKSDAEKLAAACAATDGHTVESYIAACKAARVVAVEEYKAAGGYDIWKNLGWCGRRDLAEKLASKEQFGDYLTKILEAKEG